MNIEKALKLISSNDALLKNLFGQTIKFCITFVTQIILARNLAVTDFGIVGLFAPILVFSQVLANAGFSSVIIQKSKIGDTELDHLQTVGVAISIFTMLVVAILTPIVAMVYGDNRLYYVGILSAIAVFFGGIQSQRIAYLSRNMRFGTIAIIEVTALIAGSVTALAICFYSYSYIALVLMPVVTNITSYCLLLSYRAGRVRRHLLKLRGSRDVTSGFQIVALEVLGALNSTLDNLMIGFALGPYELGLYDRVWKTVASPLSQMLSPFGRVIVPQLSRVRESDAEYRKISLRYFTLIFTATTPPLVVCLVEADALIPALFGSKWEASVPIFRWICFGALISPLNAMIFWLFVSQEKNKEQLKYGSCAILINLGSYAVGLFYGAVGVAAASSVSVYVLQAPLLLFGIHDKKFVSAKMLVWRLVPFIVCCLIIWVSALYGHFSISDIFFLDLLSKVIIVYALQISLIYLYNGYSKSQSANIGS